MSIMNIWKRPVCIDSQELFLESRGDKPVPEQDICKGELPSWAMFTMRRHHGHAYLDRDGLIAID